MPLWHHYVFFRIQEFLKRTIFILDRSICILISRAALSRRQRDPTKNIYRGSVVWIDEARNSCSRYRMFGPTINSAALFSKVRYNAIEIEWSISIEIFPTFDGFLSILILIHEFIYLHGNWWKNLRMCFEIIVKIQKIQIRRPL